MSTLGQEHSVITFLKKHGREIIEKDRQKYEVINKKETYKTSEINELEELRQEYVRLKQKYETIKKEEIYKISETNQLEELRKENIILKDNLRIEWYKKYRFYKDKYKTQKEELKQTKKEEIYNIRKTNELEELRQENIILKRLKDNNDLYNKYRFYKNKYKIQKLEQTKKKLIQLQEEEENKSNNSKGFSKIKNLDGNSDIIEKENKQIILVPGKPGKIKDINNIIKHESDINEEGYDQTNISTGEIINNYFNSRELEDLDNKTKNISIGQQIEFKEFKGSMTQEINFNRYFSELENVHKEREINRRIKDWNLMGYIYIDLILIGKIVLWIKLIIWKSIFDMILKGKSLGKQGIVNKNKVLGERIRTLKEYLMRKYEKYKSQQKVKKYKKLEICGFIERKDYNNQDGYYKENNPYESYKSLNNKRKRFRNYKNTPENRKKCKFKTKFRRKRYIKSLQKDNKNKKTNFKNWNNNEQGHYAIKCSKLKGV